MGISGRFVEGDGGREDKRGVVLRLNSSGEMVAKPSGMGGGSLRLRDCLTCRAIHNDTSVHWSG